MTDTQSKKWADMNADERKAYQAARKEQTGDQPPNLVPEEEKSDDDTRALTDLQRIALELGRAAGDSAEEQRAADHIWSLLNSLTKGAQGRLFQNPAVQRLFQTATEKEQVARTDDPPGTIYYRTLNGEKIAWSKKPWTWNDLYNPPPPRTPMPTKTWRPERQENLIWNGLAVTVFPRRNVTLPEVFYGLYEDSMRQHELAEQHARYMFADSDKPPEDPGMITVGTSVARSTSLRGTHKGVNHGVYGPGQGFVAGEPGNAQNARELDS